MGQIRKKIKTHSDAGLHALRHTFLTEAGEYTDPFTLQYVAGHDNIKTTMHYVHPREAAVPQTVYVAGRFAAARGAGCVQRVGAKSGASWDTAARRTHQVADYR